MKRRLFAAGYDIINGASEKAGLSEERHRLLAQATGATIEIGPGTGLNIEHYPESVTHLVLAEPDRHMRRRLQKRVDALRPSAEIIDASVEHLPFPDATFDTAVITQVLCSVPDPHTALEETARVLKPDGRLLFLEHVRSEDPKLAAWQDRVRPLHNLFFCCNPNRATLAAIEGSPFRVESVKHGTMPKTPKVDSPMIVGVARLGDQMA